MLRERWRLRKWKVYRGGPASQDPDSGGPLSAGPEWEIKSRRPVLGNAES